LKKKMTQMMRLSDHLEISFDTNEIISMNADNTSTKTKVEPRNMHVLRILLTHSPSVVSREQLIAEVWDNYGGADDALNQSISHLRKLLNDTNKEKRIIETVVKKGYRFVGEIDESSNKNTTPQKRRRFWIGIIAVAAIILALLFYLFQSQKSFVPKAPKDTVPATENVPAPDVD